MESLDIDYCCQIKEILLKFDIRNYFYFSKLNGLADASIITFLDLLLFSICTAIHQNDRLPPRKLWSLMKVNLHHSSANLYHRYFIKSVFLLGEDYLEQEKSRLKELGLEYPFTENELKAAWANVPKNLSHLNPYKTKE